MNKYFVLRAEGKDLWIAYKGYSNFTSDRRNIHVFTVDKDHTAEEIAKINSVKYGFKVIAENW